MSSKQAQPQIELNDLEPQQDPKGGAATLLLPYFSVDVADAGRADSIQIDSFFDIYTEVSVPDTRAK